MTQARDLRQISAQELADRLAEVLGLEGRALTPEQLSRHLASLLDLGDQREQKILRQHLVLAAVGDMLLDKQDIEAVTTLSTVTQWHAQRRGDFPAYRQISPNKVGCLASEVRDFILGRPPVRASGPED